MEASTDGQQQVHQEPPAEAVRKRGPITYAVYQAQSADVVKDTIASELVLLKRTVAAHDEAAARWKVVDDDENLTAQVKDGETLYLVAIPERRATIKHTRIERKVDEKRL